MKSLRFYVQLIWFCFFQYPWDLCLEDKLSYIFRVIKRRVSQGSPINSSPFKPFDGLTPIFVIGAFRNT